MWVKTKKKYLFCLGKVSFPLQKNRKPQLKSFCDRSRDQSCYTTASFDEILLLDPIAPMTSHVNMTP